MEKLQLNKIEISNARRLSKKIMIEFGEGATILTAPNGIGKTTIFESIELAITNIIQRNKKEMGAFVSENSDEMSVCLNFTDNQYTKVTLDKSGKSDRYGDIFKILQVSPDISISYLYKMTHFFEQNSKNWFVGCNETDAGKLLGSLPISRDIQNILSKKTSILRAFTTMKKNADTELELTREELKSFEEMYDRLTQIECVMTKDEFESVKSEMRKLAFQYNIEIESYDDELTKLYAVWESVKSRIIEKKEANQNVLNKLLAFDNRIDFYIENHFLVNEKIKYYNFLKQQMEIKEKVRQESFRQKESILKKKQEEEEKRNKADRIISQYDTITIKEKNINDKKIILEKYNFDIEKFTQEEEEQNKVIERFESIRETQEILSETLKTEKVKLIDLQRRIKILKDWKVKKTDNIKCSEKAGEFEDMLKKAKTKKERIGLELAQCKADYYDKRDNLSLLRKSEEETLNALYIIKKAIKFDTKICPVCQTEFSSGVLEKKIENAMKRLNPLLEKMDKEEKKADSIVKEKEKSLLEIEEEVADIERTYKELIHQKEEFINIIDVFKRDLLIEDDEINLEYDRVNKKIGEQQNKIVDLNSRLENLPKLDEDTYHLMVETKREIERKQKQLKNYIDSIKVEIENENHDIDNLKNKLIGENKDKYLSLKEKSVLKIEEYDQTIEKKKEESSILRDELKMLEEDIISEESAISTINAALADVINEWKQFCISDIPNKEMSKKEINRLQEKDIWIEKDLNIFYDLQRKLLIWKASQERVEIEKKLKEKVGNRDIKQYHKYLRKQFDEKERYLKNIQDKKEASEFFLDEIVQESKKIQSQIEEINESWKKILKRIVVNPLISSAPLLENKTAYNKAVASTKAVIHNEDIDITNIASEGQIADLQLSFILAMANKYNWTPWKALLLDDPMQHHDLVHTSSIIDILRDYILDSGYQVMLSTHDMLQADYFARKFKNDGIRCKIYQLVPGEGGVLAERIQ